jgi:hypothetical protein
MPNKNKNWIQSAIKRPGAFTAKAKSKGVSVPKLISQVKKNPSKYSTRTVRQANLANTLRKFQAAGATNAQMYSTKTPEGYYDQLNQELLELNKGYAEAQKQRQEQQSAANQEALTNTVQTSATQIGKGLQTALKGSEATNLKGIAQGLKGTSAGTGLLGAGLSLAGAGIQKASDDKDSTKYNAGEIGGGLMGGIGKGLGAAGTLGMLAPALAVPGIGWAAAGIGAAAAGAKMLIDKRKAVKEKEKNDEMFAKSRRDIVDAQQKAFEQERTMEGMDQGFNIGMSQTNSYVPSNQRMYMKKGGEMIKRADGSYSQRGLWDNIRANKGSGKKPTKQMLEQEKKIKANMMSGGQALKGGAMLPMSNTAVEFVGNKHNKGGIMLDRQTEVEGGETMDKVMFKQGGAQDYIFSDYLKLGGKTFASRHKNLVKSGASRAQIQELAKLQEQVAKKKGRDENGPRDPEKIAQAGGVRKYQTGNAPATTTASNTPPPEPPFNPWAPSLTTTFAIQGNRGIDKETTIGGQPTGNLSGTGWGQYYSQYPLFEESPERFYDEVYTPGVREYFSNNPDQAYAQLQKMVRGDDPNADNFRKILLDKDGKMLPKEQALAKAEELATDKNVGSFHMLLPLEKPKDMIPIPIIPPGTIPTKPPGGTIPGDEDKPGDIPKIPPGITIPEKPPIIPPYQTIGPLAALATKYPKVQGAAAIPSGRLNLPRVNFNAERAASAAGLSAANKALENQVAGPASIAARMAQTNSAREANLKTSTAEAQANKELAANEAQINAGISSQNAQRGLQASMFNAQNVNARNQAEYEQNLLGAQGLGTALAQYQNDLMSYKFTERLARANQIDGEYDRAKMMENMEKDARRNKTSPFRDMTLYERRMNAAALHDPTRTLEEQESQRRTAMIEGMKAQNQQQQQETEQKKKGGKYIKRSNKINRRR